MESLKDVNVVIDVLHPAPVIGLGRPLILVASNKASYKEYNVELSLESIKEDYDITTATYKLAETIFAQANKSDVICIATYVGESPALGESLAEVVDEYFGKSWHFALSADGTPPERLVLSNKVELHDFKFAVVQVSDPEEVKVYKNNPHTIVYYHTNEGERLDGAVVGDAANLTVGSITWKFRKNLKGVTPIEITPSALDKLHEAGANAYVLKAGIPQTSEGLVATGEYIDFYHGRDWIKANMETNLQSMLVNNDKVPANSNGVSLIAAVATSTLTTAGQQGIIDVNEEDKYDFNVYTKSFDEGKPSDIQRRIYSGLTFDYKAQGAIHKINVKGSVMSNK